MGGARRTRDLPVWETMNGWVYEGFDGTYEALGVGFDKVYCKIGYLPARQVDRRGGLDKGVFS